MVDISNIEKKLTEKEEALDEVILKGRTAVRSCSNTIKAVHAGDMKTAKKHLGEAEKTVKQLLKRKQQFPNQVNHVLQEYAEALITLEAVQKKRIPGQKELDVEEVPYVLGLLDSVGELKREMYESIRKNKKKDAEKYFALMEEIFDALLPLRFSNAILPEFRRKQDVARIQIEQARGELL